MPVTRSQTRISQTTPSIPVPSTPTKTKTVKVPDAPMKPRVERMHLEITPTSTHIETKTVSKVAGKPNTEIKKEMVNNVKFTESKAETPLYALDTQWQRQMFIDACREEVLDVDPDYVYYEYNEETGVYRIPLDDNFHNTLASIYYEEGVYLVPMEELFYTIDVSLSNPSLFNGVSDVTKRDTDGSIEGTTKRTTYMQFMASDVFSSDDEVETHRYSTKVGETLIGYFIHTNYCGHVPVNFAHNTMNRKYYTGILMYLWSQGIYTNVVWDHHKFHLSFYRETIGELDTFSLSV